VRSNERKTLPQKPKSILNTFSSARFGHPPYSPRRDCFPQFIHRFARGFCENFVDGKNQNIYLAPQIEPEA
jgi:hypothetical protein